MIIELDGGKLQVQSRTHQSHTSRSSCRDSGTRLADLLASALAESSPRLGLAAVVPLD